MPTPLHVLIAGPSASGKSTLARAVGLALRRRVLSLDDFFDRTQPCFYVETAQGPVRTYEDPRSYDGAALARQAEESAGGVVIEGLSLFLYPAIQALPAHWFYVDVPFATCLERRLARKPARRSDLSFQLVGEAESARHVGPQARLPGVVVLDGLRPTTDLLQQVLGVCQPNAHALTYHD